MAAAEHATIVYIHYYISINSHTASLRREADVRNHTNHSSRQRPKVIPTSFSRATNFPAVHSESVPVSCQANAVHSCHRSPTSFLIGGRPSAFHRERWELTDGSVESLWPRVRSPFAHSDSFPAGSAQSLVEECAASCMRIRICFSAA